MSFIVNRWVRGNDFIGRTALLRGLFETTKKTVWVLGNRRVGKTSLLRQIAWLCGRGDWGDTLALYWDLQGAATPDGLRDALLESLEDAEDIAEALGLDVDSLEDLAFSDLLNRLRRKVKSLRRRFLLLIDECEELVEVAAADINVLSSFRRLSQTESPLQIVLVGSYRFMDLDESGSRTSLFLPDFLPPTLLGPFDPEESASLLARNDLDAEIAAEIHRITLGNPHLVQVLGEHYRRLGSIPAALASVTSGKIAEYYFQSNFQCLPEPYRHWWGAEDLLERLAGVTREDPYLPYLKQACIMSGEGTSNALSPLLLWCLGGAPIPAADGSPAQDTAPRPAPTAVAPVEPCGAYLDWLAANPRSLLVLGPGQDPEGATNPPALSLLASLQESPAELHALLGGATPEYVRGESATARTSVYLAGLCLYRHYFDKSPHADIADPWQRASAIAEQDVPVRPAEAVVALDSKTAICLMRSLKARASERYPDIAALRADLLAR